MFSHFSQCCCSLLTPSNYWVWLDPAKSVFISVIRSSFKLNFFRASFFLYWVMDQCRQIWEIIISNILETQLHQCVATRTAEEWADALWWESTFLPANYGRFLATRIFKEFINYIYLMCTFNSFILLQNRRKLLLHNPHNFPVIVTILDSFFLVRTLAGNSLDNSLVSGISLVT